MKLILKYQTAHKPWKYMRAHVRHSMSEKKLIHSKPFAVATYAPMVRLNIEFIGPINTNDDNVYYISYSRLINQIGRTLRV